MFGIIYTMVNSIYSASYTQWTIQYIRYHIYHGQYNIFGIINTIHILGIIYTMDNTIYSSSYIRWTIQFIRHHIYVTVNLRNQFFPGIPNPFRESRESQKSIEIPGISEPNLTRIL